MGGYLDGAPLVPLGMVAFIKSACLGEGIARHKDASGQEPLHRFDVGFGKIVYLGQNNKQIRRVKTLDIIGVGGGKAHGPRIVAYLITRCLVHATAKVNPGVHVAQAQLAEHDVTDLAVSRSQDNCFGRRPRMKPPQDSSSPCRKIFAAVVVKDTSRCVVVGKRNMNIVELAKTLIRNRSNSDRLCGIMVVV